MVELRRSEHHIYKLAYHLVFCPKYRHPVFKEPQRTMLREILIKAAYDYDMEIEEIEIPEDHIHMLIIIPPPISISRCMQILKSISAREFFKRYPDIRNKYFWGGTLWSPSFYAETIGRKDEDAVRHYINQQLEEETKHIQKLQQLKLFA